MKMNMNNEVLFFRKYIKTVNISYNSQSVFSIKKKYINHILECFYKSTFYQMNTLMEYTASHELSRKQHRLFLMLLSTLYDNRIILQYTISNFDTIESITFLFKSANWSEREIYDMFGIFFTNHPDLRRILTDYGFDGHPLQKEFPLFGYYEIFYSDADQNIISKKIYQTKHKSIKF